MNGRRMTCWPEQRERRHAVAGLPEVLDQRELAVRVGPDEPAIHLEVVSGGVQILARQRRVRLAQEHHGLGRCGGRIVLGERRRHQVHLLLGLVDGPSLLGTVALLGVAGALALAHGAPAGRQVCLQREGDHGLTEAGVPVS